jgi:hypothetical protein
MPVERRMSTTFAKSQKTAAELAKMIRRSVDKPALRVAVFGSTRGWKAKVYPKPGENAAWLQFLVDQKSEILREHYELGQ